MQAASSCSNTRTAKPMRFVPMHSGRTRCERELTLAQRKLRHTSLAGSNYVRSRRPRPNGSPAGSYPGRPQGSIQCLRIAGSGGPLDIHGSLERGPCTQAPFRSQQLLKADSHSPSAGRGFSIPHFRRSGSRPGGWVGRRGTGACGIGHVAGRSTVRVSVVL
jgi:hypothetical protein